MIATVGLKADGKTRGLKMLRWGLIPHWAKDLQKSPKPINARAESLFTKPMFARLMK